MDTSYGSGRMIPRTLDGEMQREHEQEVAEQVRKAHQADEAAKRRRPRWASWRRLSQRPT